MAVSMVSVTSAPFVQEICLVAFFCLGFVICRSKVVQGLFRRQRLGSVELLALRRQARFEEVLDAWPCLDDFTLQAFNAVVEALLALNRPEDVGLFFYKTAVNLVQLRGSLHKSIRHIEQTQAPRECIGVALREVFEQRAPLDVLARQELLVALARTNNATLADKVVLELKEVPQHISCRCVEGFLSCSDIEAAMRYLPQVEGSQFKELLAQTAYAVEADAEDQRSRMSALLTLCHGMPAVLACALRVSVELRDEALYRTAASAVPRGASVELLEALVPAAMAFDAEGGRVLLDLAEDEVLRQVYARATGAAKEFLAGVRCLGAEARAASACGAEDVAGLDELLPRLLAQKGGFKQAKSLFEKPMPGPLARESYQGLVSAAIACGDRDFAWRCVEAMEREGHVIDAQILTLFFKGVGCRSRPHDFDQAMQLTTRHSECIDAALAGCILEACAALRDTRRLNHVLTFLERRGWKLPLGGASCSTLIKAFGASNQMHKAQELWQSLKQQEAVPNEHVYAQMIDVLVSGGRFEEALEIFGEMQNVHCERIGSTGVSMAYAMIVKGYTQQKDAPGALQCYEEMKAKGVLVGVVVLNTLMDACCRCGDLQSAGRLLEDMVRLEIAPDLITYSTLIKGHCAKGDLDKALELFGAMRRRGIKPDAIVFNSLLDGCARKELPMLCEQVINDMIAAGVRPSNYSASILIKLYGRISDLDAAFKVLEEMPGKFGFRPNAAVYTTLMSSCTWNGRMDLAMGLKNRMVQDGQVPDEKTYSTLLRGAARAGDAENINTLLWEALEQESDGRGRLLETDALQNAVQSLWRGGVMFEALLQRLIAAGYEVKRQGKTSTSCARPRRSK